MDVYLPNETNKFLMNSQSSGNFSSIALAISSLVSAWQSMFGSKTDGMAEAEIGYCLGYRWWHQGIMTEALENGLRERFYNTPGIEERIEALKKDILDNKISPYAAADQLLA